MRTKEWKKEEEKGRKKKSIHDHVMGCPIDGAGVGQNLHINVHSTEQWSWMSLPSLNELGFLSLKNHPLHPLAQARDMISGTFQFPLNSISGEKAFFSHANNCIVSDLFRDRQEDSGKVSSRNTACSLPFPPLASLTPLSPRAP